MMEDTTGDSEGKTTEFAVGDRYRLTDDGTEYEVVGITDGGVDVSQYDDAGDVQGEYTISMEEFHHEIVEPAS